MEKPSLSSRNVPITFVALFMLIITYSFLQHSFQYFYAKYILLFYKNISNRSVKSAAKTSIGLHKIIDKQKNENENHSQKDQSFVSRKADT